MQHTLTTLTAFTSLVLQLAVAYDPANIAVQLTSSSIGLSPGTHIFFPTDQNWTTETTQRYTVHDAPGYIASIKPALESDVQKIVAFCSTNHIPFLATGGGHGFATTFGKLQNGIEIDLGFFRSVSVNTTASTMTIGGAVIFNDIFEPLYNAGKEIQTGSSPCVGMVGATLGGGVGRYNGLHGMIVDALLSVRIITGTGELVTASETENSDLFWGIRGAGMNYGIILSATYQAYDLTSSQVMNADIDLPLNSSGKLMEYLKSYENTLPAKLSIILRSTYAEENGGAYITINAVYAGPLSEGTALIQPILSANPIRQNITMVPWGSYINATFWGAGQFGCPKRFNANVYGGSVKTYDIPTFQKFFSDWNGFLKANPAAQEQSVFFIETFPTQAVRAVPDNTTAYPHRDITAHLLFNFGYPVNDTATNNAANAFGVQSRSNFAVTSGFDGLQVYVSYGHGDEGAVPLYGERKLPRLMALKKRWDPQNFFRYDEPLV
ncbi:FAD-binding domain-containing protein [Glonium stellatum]|uniref:FAD-binding domain-containing protein n=1 Tax=Glonium stellatum TaxID=574774 RepID=A0A8E2JN87_9PEZI|nr:FAD-binding domain-containing protein [Glonium stellatum]